MNLTLETIVFNHDLTGAANDGLSVRLTRADPAPDWTSTATVPSVAAYALAVASKKAKSLSIQATFAWSGAPVPGPITVRARPVDPANDVLGSVAETVLPLPVGAKGPVVLSLENVGIWGRGVGRYEMSWQWQTQLSPGGAWLDFGRSDHIIYVTLNSPGAPWSQASDVAHRVEWPWASVLDWSCRWAAGVKIATSLGAALNKAAGLIELGLYELGAAPNSLLAYDDEALFTTPEVFDCSQFLDVINRTSGAPTPTTVNCSDCAAALITFANAIGCDLQLRRIDTAGGGTFTTNPLRSVGAGSSQSFSFGFHEVAVRETTSRGVYDACMKIDRDSDPTRPKPSLFKLSKGLAIGSLGKSGTFLAAAGKRFKYCHRVLIPADVTTCRAEDQETLCLDQCVDPHTVSRSIVDLKDLFTVEIDRRAKPIEDRSVPVVSLEPIAIADYVSYATIREPLRFSWPPGLVIASADFFYASTAAVDKRPARTRRADRRIRVSIAYAASAENARTVMAWLMTSNSALPRVFDAADDESGGDLMFVSPSVRSAFLVYRSTIASVQTIGTEPVPVVPVMNRVFGELRRRYPTASPPGRRREAI